ncbi:MAG: TRAM domain-containing protein [Phycisphaerae bacterium]|nr:TRAM domain-containing protein [Phycisphaerae bacterium]
MDESTSVPPNPELETPSSEVVAGAGALDAAAADASAAELALAKSRRYDLPSVQAKQEARSRRLLMLVVRLLFLVLLGTVTILTIASERRTEDFGFSTIGGLFLATTSIGIIVLTLDAITPNKRLSSVVGVYLGVCFGLIGAIAVGSLLDVVADAWDLSGGRQALYLGLGKVIVGIVLCYLSVSVVLTTKDDFRLVIPYVEFAKQVRGVRPLVVDTSVLIDGRINELGSTGFLDAPLVCPQFVVDELQALADSSDKIKRTRGRRGLDVLARMQANPYLDLSIDDPRVEGVSVDRMLIELAKDQKLRILTTDSNLKKVAQINGVPVININDLANTLKAAALPGETLTVAVIKAGETEGQGVGYLPDGTMVVIEDAGPHVGSIVHAVVTNSLQTSAGRMIFAKVERAADTEGTSISRLASAATHQPRALGRGPRGGPPPEGRNPRR